MSRRRRSCPPWCARHHKVHPGYWVHQGPDVIVRSDTDAPLARVSALVGTVSGEDFGPQVNMDLITTRLVEEDGSYTYAPATLSPDETHRLAAALMEAVTTLNGYQRP